MCAHKVSSKQRIVTVTMRLFFGGLLMSAVTASAETPDTFTWVGKTNNWNDASVWTAAATGRTAPSIKGDGMVVPTINAIKLTNNVTISSATYSYGGSWTYATSSRLLSDGVPATLSLEASISGSNVIVKTSATRLYLGGYPSDNALEIELKSPLWLYQSAGGYYGLAVICGKLVGGTVGTPAINVQMYPSYGNARCILMNSANTFSGDLHVGVGSANNDGSASLLLGAGAVNFSDGMLGNAANKIFLYRSNSNLYILGGISASFARRVIGMGAVRGGGITDVNAQYPSPNTQTLTLGSGCSIEPAEGTNTQKTGVITLAGTTLSMDTNAQVVFSVNATTNDMVKLSFSSTSTAINFTGKVVVEELATIAPGRQCNLMTINGNIAGFSFNPSATPPEYAFTTTGDATAGWIVKATRLNTSIPSVQNLDATLVGETNATLHASVNQLVPDGAGVIRAYYGETNVGSNFSAWDHVVSYPSTATTSGVYDLVLNGLQVGKTYYVCHSISNSAGEYAAADVVSFTTRPWETPDVFTWIATNADWHTKGVWLITTPYQRMIPEFKGDKIIVNVGGSGWPTAGINRTLNLTNDIAIGSMTINEGYGSLVAVTATNGPAKLTFDADATGTNYLSATGQLAGLRLGNDVGDPSLTVEIKQPLVFQKNTAYDLDFSIYSPILGGSEVSPTPIFFNAIGDQYCRLYASILNTNNTFRGDLYIGAGQVFEASSMLTVGNASRTARNEMLGDPANQVFLRNNSTLRYYAPTNLPAVVNRQIRGNGTLSSTKALYLASDAVVDPRNISGSGLGTININATALTADSSAQYALNVTPTNNVCDKLVVTVSSPLVLTGTLKLEPTSVAKISVGTSWPVISVATNATAFTCALKKSSGYILTTSGNATTGWTVTATAAPLNTILIVR